MLGLRGNQIIMIKAAKTYVKIMDSISTYIGNIIKFLVLFNIGLLAYEAISRNFFNAPHKWSLEMTQFVNGTYYLIGGAYTLLVGGHARMDFLYEDWSARKKAVFDILTFVFVIAFLIILINGGYKSAAYAIKYKQITYSAWGPPVAPIKIISIVGMVLMLLQNIAELIKDIAIAVGKDDQWFTRRQEEIT
jgi:TRAP-type mannitol/chloroaromatic compound transport system permease small subunit